MNRTSYAGFCEYCVARVGIRKFRSLNNGICSECETRQKQLGLSVYHPQPKPEKAAKVQVAKAPRIPNPLLKVEENQVVQVFNELQSEGMGRNWRVVAAERLGWSQEKVKEVVKRARQDVELIPVPIEQQLIAHLTNEWQSACQILPHFPNLKYEWIHVNLDRLVDAGEIDCRKCKPNKTLYRLKQ